MNLASIARSHRKGEMSVAECVDELLLTGYVKESDVLHLFALWFLHDKDNRNSYCAAKTTALRFKFVEYCFEYYLYLFHIACEPVVVVECIRYRVRNKTQIVGSSIHDQ
ncbi:Hypothetical predicted protein [Olea europaea subsp. europaea]|uniref:Uncharacterized protein n=1 Tax=Olea europaea subsp. europaea TaxID=158383 RepID=A0A8S0QW23_OLEEU|nr:Hypothetical predicted protein [Olea europaea subsp. europaea]